MHASRLSPHCIASMLLAAGSAWATPHECGSGLSPIDYAEYFNALPKDGAACRMSVQGSGDKAHIVVDPLVSNPAMSCPDMFAWKLYADVIRDRWWVRWAAEDQNWPAQPYALCAGNESPKNTHCCAFGDAGNDPKHCPVFPGALAQQLHIPLLRAPLDQPPTLRPSFAADVHGVSRRLLAIAQAQTDDKEHIESIGRQIRQDNNEYTVRNEAFHDFVFRNDLYNTEGVAAVFARNAQFLATNAPYRATPAAAGGVLTSIDFPPDAIMIKSNWIKEDLARELHLPEDPNLPYIKKEFLDGEGHRGVYWLVALHISSKDIPNWVWATFEHVSMPGRCDITGCNDSFGYLTTDTLPAGAARNFVAPKTTCDRLAAASIVFSRDRLYAPEQRTAALGAIFDGMRIGVAAAKDPKNPDALDAAWRSYRLKGTQVDFADATGRATMLANSITEAGFVNGSSCMTCHARAGTDELGPAHPNLPDRGTFPLGVFVNAVSDFGYGMSANGLPNPAWFHESNTPPRLHVLQTDFVWGFMNANRVVK
ncbi:MAG TPA: hypothetical protein VFB32_07845 [Rudaea sp.]|nr:hypothetical protein [Rudaea sp.]